MQRKFITNLFFLLFLNFLVKPFWILGIDRSVQNTVGAESYGEYFALFNFSLLLNIFLDVGITNFNNRNIARHKHLLTKHFPKIFSVRILLGFVYIGITLLSGLFLGYSEMRLKLLSILALNQFLAATTLFLRSNISGLHLFKTDSIISVLDRFLMIVICGVLLWSGVTDEPFRITWFIYAQTAAYLVTAVAAFIVVATQAKTIKIRLHRPFAIMILRKSLPYALLILLMTFYYRLDSIMLDKMLDNGEQEAGIYAQAYRLLEASNMIGYLFSVLLLPIFSSMIKKNEDVKSLIRLSFGLLFAGAMILAVISVAYSREIMELLYNEHTARSAPVLSVLMCCFVPIAVSYVFGTLLTANGSIKILNYIALSGVLVNFLLNLLLIPQYEAMGSAVASLITQMTAILVQVFVAWRIFLFKTDLKYTFRLVIFVVSLLFFMFYLPRIEVEWYLSMLLLLLASCAMAIFTGFIRSKELYRLVFRYGE